jgi:type I restriction enzyme, S subunit
MTPALARPKAFAVWFKELERWNVSSFFRIWWKWPSVLIRPLADALEPKPILVDRSRFPLDQLHLVTLHFGGEMEPRDMQGKATFKGRLFFAEAGDVIYSKIDVRNGAIGVVPSSLPTIAVSSEYPVYRVRPNVALPEYVKLLFRTAAFRQQINSMISGASGRKRVQPSDLQDVKVPIPHLSVQGKMVLYWRKAQEDAAKSRDAVAALEGEIQGGIFNALSIKPPKADRPLSKAFALRWIDLERWSVDFLARDALSRSGSVSSFPMTTLGAIAQISYGIQKCPANRPGKHPRPYLRVANVQRGGLDLREIKHIDVPDSELEAFRLSSGDLLVCEGNSADLVGRPALWNDEIPDCVHQNHVLRVRVDQCKALPEFLLEYMSTFYARAYFRSRAKFTTNLASINSNDLRGLPLPIPSLEVQRKIVDMVNEKRVRIAEERKAAEERRAQATREVEEMILGVRSAG